MNCMKKNNKRLLLVIICWAIFIVTNAQRDTINLNDDWQFVTDKQEEGLAQQWQQKKLPGAKTVQLPHTWNVEEGNHQHYGWGWYQRWVTIPAGWKTKNVVLQLEAVNHTSHIYINDKKVYENIGDGFNKFYVNLNEKLLYGGVNVITVAVNNNYGKVKVPFGNSFDWPNDGGIIRPISLIVSNKPAAAYLHATPQLQLSDSSGKITLKRI